LLIDREGIRFEDLQFAGEMVLQFCEGRNAPTVSFYGDYAGACLEQCSREATRTGTHFVHAFAGKTARDRGNAR
jgi:hypothetical protein